MRRLWLLFSQTVTVAVAVLFVVGTLKPGWLQRAPSQWVPPSVSLAPADLTPAADGTAKANPT
eukprot:gene35784-48121_t